MENNPYSTPNANLDSQSSFSDETNDKGVFDFSGRIGRLRYIAYGFAISLLMVIIGGVVGGILGVVGLMESPVIMNVVIGLLYIPMIIYTFVHAKRRFNDRGNTGWLAALMIIPGINLLVWFYLVLAPGEQANNAYGAPPRPNNALIYAASLILPIVMIGILAAIAIPAYQDYVERAQQAQLQMSQ